ncbi:MAG: metallophosphoesterase [Deltaproteobacteria bacterium]|nr:metallophosphoesterase [Deltaproteobacteria bacterium]
MRAKLAIAIVTLCTLVVTAAADEDTVPPPPPARGTQLIKATAVWRWQITTAPTIPRGVGAMAATAGEVAAGRARAPSPVLGEPGPIPASWPYDVAGLAPVIPKPADGQRIAAAFGITSFQISDADARISMLELRLRYRDGVAAWINGVEVLRQGLPRGPTNTLALRQRGPEWETFYIAVAPGLLRRGANTLAVEVHPSGRRTAPSLLADLIGRSDRGILRGPALVETTQTTATIVVDTDPDVDATLEWGAGEALSTIQKSPPGRRHVFVLANLSPDARFSYRVRAGSSQSAKYTFSTLPKAGAEIRIGIYGDVRGGHSIHRRLLERMLAEGLDFVVVSGDMVTRGSDEGDWQQFFGLTQDLRAQLPYYPAIGNHDLGMSNPDGTSRADKMFSLPPAPSGRPPDSYWYSRDVSDIHLVFLDSNNYDRGDQETWLEADLAAARKRGVRSIVVITHDGPFARGYHGGNTLARARYVPILARHKVDLVISGHDHIYQRGEHLGLRYLVSGGGGAPLYAIRCGVPGRPKCSIEDGMQHVAREYHYAVMTIGRDVELCPRRPDGSLLEKCVRYPLGKP